MFSTRFRFSRRQQRPQDDVIASQLAVVVALAAAVWFLFSLFTVQSMTTLCTQRVCAYEYMYVCLLLSCRKLTPPFGHSRRFCSSSLRRSAALGLAHSHSSSLSLSLSLTRCYAWAAFVKNKFVSLVARRIRLPIGNALQLLCLKICCSVLARTAFRVTLWSCRWRCCCSFLFLFLFLTSS